MIGKMKAARSPPRGFRFALVVDRGAEQLKLTLFPESGLVRGNFIHPDSLKKIFRKQNVGTGFFPGGPLGGAVSVTPNP